MPVAKLANRVVLNRPGAGACPCVWCEGGCMVCREGRSDSPSRSSTDSKLYAVESGGKSDMRRRVRDSVGVEATGGSVTKLGEIGHLR